MGGFDFRFSSFALVCYIHVFSCICMGGIKHGPFSGQKVYKHLANLDNMPQQSGQCIWLVYLCLLYILLQHHCQMCLSLVHLKSRTELILILWKKISGIKLNSVYTCITTSTGVTIWTTFSGTFRNVPFHDRMVQCKSKKVCCPYYAVGVI